MSSPAEDAARALLTKSTSPQIDALRFRLNLPDSSPREAAPSTRQYDLWLDAQRAGGTQLAVMDELLCEQQGRPAPAYWLYVSCTVGEKDTAAYQHFFDRLSVKLRARGICQNDDLRHLDAIRSPSFTDWPAWSLRAMQKCRVLLCLYSKDYFDGPYCGKIWGAFLSRLRAQLGYEWSTGGPPPLIVPILWGPPEENPSILPRVVRSVPVPQFGFDPEYEQKGLFFLQKLAVAKRENYEARYDAILDAIADQVEAAAGLNVLQEDPNIPSLSEIPDVFHQAIGGANAARESTPYARFIFFVATKNNIAVLRDPACYGDEPEHWRPYSPPADEILEWIAISCSRELGRTAYVIRLDPAFRATLLSANSNGEPIVAIADPWTVHTRIYSAYEQDYDTTQLSCTRLLVCWDEKDAETRKLWPTLRKTLRESAFPAKYNSVFPEKIREEVVSLDQFRTELTTAILSSHTQILDEVTDQRVATGRTFVRPVNIGAHPLPADAPAEPVRMAGTDPGQFISRPKMQGPIGGPAG